MSIARSASPSSRWSRGLVDRRAGRRPRAAPRSRPRRRAARRPRRRWGRARCARRSAGLGLVDRRLGRLHLGGQLLGPGQQRGLLVARSAFGIRLPSCFCSARSASKRCDRRPPRLVGARAGRRRRTRTRPGPAGWHGRVRVVAEQAQVNHEAEPTGGRAGGRTGAGVDRPPSVEVEAEVEHRRAVGERADGQVVDAGRGDLARPVERQPAAGLQPHARCRGRAPPPSRVSASEKLSSSTSCDAGRHRLADLVEGVALDLERDVRRAFAAPRRPPR